MSACLLALGVTRCPFCLTQDVSQVLCHAVAGSNRPCVRLTPYPRLRLVLLLVCSCRTLAQCSRSWYFWVRGVTITLCLPLWNYHDRGCELALVGGATLELPRWVARVCWSGGWLSTGRPCLVGGMLSELTCIRPCLFPSVELP